MDKINETLLTSIDRYFNHLKNFGKIDKGKTNTILVFLFIKQIVTGPMSIYVTNEDYKILDDVLYCLYGSSCLIDYPTFKLSHSMFENIDNDQYIKVLEDGVINRYSENNNLMFQIL